MASILIIFYHKSAQNGTLVPMNNWMKSLESCQISIAIICFLILHTVCFHKNIVSICPYDLYHLPKNQGWADRLYYLAAKKILILIIFFVLFYCIITLENDSNILYQRAFDEIIGNIELSLIIK